MKKQSQSGNEKDRAGERGAALITVLMISFFLLAAITALLFEASTNTANVTDATAEQQAYYAAESGVQSVIDLLRHNRPPSPLIDATKMPYPPDPDADPANRIDYFKAVRIPTSNATNPTAAQCAAAPRPLDCTPRLSRWLNYGNAAAYPDRIALGPDPVNYNERNGFAYKVTVEDPDNVGGTVEYNTTNTWTQPTVPAATNVLTIGSNQLRITDTTNNNELLIQYSSLSPYTKDVSSGQAATDFGKFTITGSGPTFDTDGVVITEGIRFIVRVYMTQPYTGVRLMRGYLEKGTVKANSVGTVKLFFDSRDYVMFSSLISLTGGTLVEEKPPALPSGPDGTFRTGYEVVPTPPGPASAPGETTITGTFSAPEPLRIVVRATGYGPMGARKELEAVIQKNYFSGLGAPSPLTLIGPPCTPVGPPVDVAVPCVPVVPLPVPPANPAQVAPNFIFNPGSSNSTIYNGKDKLLKAFLPPVGITHDPNLLNVRAALRGEYGNPFNGSVFGNVANIAEELPYWLSSPRTLDKTLEALKLVAQASNKYTAPAATPPGSGGGRYGDYLTASGITFIDRDLEFSQDGGGILVVTGQLKFKGGFRFNGLVIVTGAGGIIRTGGGSGSLQGNMVVAPYSKVGLANSLTCADDINVLNKLDCFLAPRYDISGGGGSEIVYNSNNVANGLSALTNFAKGVAEK
jgi:hypothetical protein